MFDYFLKWSMPRVLAIRTFVGESLASFFIFVLSTDGRISERHSSHRELEAEQLYDIGKGKSQGKLQNTRAATIYLHMNGAWRPCYTPRSSNDAATRKRKSPGMIR